MFDRDNRFLKREAETLEWLDLPVMGGRERTPRRRIAAILCAALLATLAALIIAPLAAG